MLRSGGLCDRDVTAYRVEVRLRRRGRLGAMSGQLLRTSPNPPARRVETASGAAIAMGGLTALLWLTEILDVVFMGWFDSFGIRAWDLSSLPAILWAPLLHFGFSHLISNTLPFFVLGWLVLVGRNGMRRWLGASAIITVVSGLAAWFLSAPGTITAGASGLIFGWVTYLVLRGVLARDIRALVISVVVLIGYGGVLWGVLPTQTGISWQAHLGGAVGGLLAAWIMRPERPARDRPLVR